MEMTDVLKFITQAIHYPLLTVNQTPITIGSLAVLVLIFSIFVVASRVIVRILGSRVLSRFQIDDGLRYSLQRTLQYVLVVIGAVVAFEFIGINLSGLAVIFGFLSVGIGFGLQNVTSNFASGLIILFERHVKVGDRVTVGDIEGDVTAINLRSTTVRSVRNISIIVPNSEFVSERVINWSHGDTKVRIEVNVGVSYESDLETVLRCLREVADENPDVLKSPEPDVLHVGFGDSSWDMRLRCWIPDPKRNILVRSALNCAIVRKFHDNGVEIPFPQRDLHIRSTTPVPVAPQQG
jgi:small-conductance mechanosensitive channel